jgi:hypothetical protein
MFIILFVIRFTDKFLFDVINGSPININLCSNIAFTLYLLNEFIFNNISVGLENMQA